MPVPPRRLSMNLSFSRPGDSSGLTQTLLAHAAALREGVGHFPILHQVLGINASRLVRADGETEAAHWLRWWSGKESVNERIHAEVGAGTVQTKNNKTKASSKKRDKSADASSEKIALPGLVNTDCHVLKGWNVSIEPDETGAGGDEEDPVLDGSWKILDGAAGGVKAVSLENRRGSVLEVWNADWRLEACAVRCGGPFEVAPVCIYAWRGARLQLHSCTVGALEGCGAGGRGGGGGKTSAPEGAGGEGLHAGKRGGKVGVNKGGGAAAKEGTVPGVAAQRRGWEPGMVAHNGVVLCNASCEASGCVLGNFSSSDVYVGDGANLSLTRCRHAKMHLPHVASRICRYRNGYPTHTHTHIHTYTIHRSDSDRCRHIYIRHST